jgi:hypothetical protein
MAAERVAYEEEEKRKAEAKLQVREGGGKEGLGCREGSYDIDSKGQDAQKHVIPAVVL